LFAEATTASVLPGGNKDSETERKLNPQRKCACGCTAVGVKLFSLPKTTLGKRDRGTLDERIAR